MSQADSGLSEDEDAVMQDIGVGGDEEFGGSNEGIESGDVSSLNQTMGMVSTPAAAAPRYQNFLDLFQMDKLRLEQRSFANIARHMESSSEQRKTLLALGDYAQGFLGDRHSVEFASLLSRMWPAHTARVERIDVTDFRLSMERRQLMLYGATAWSWLTRDCVARIQDITEALDENAEAYAGCSDWLVALVRDVYAKVRRGGPAIYQASRYLPNVENTSRTVTISTSIAQQKNAASHTNNSVIRLLRDWLCFPNNTSLLAAYVVIHILNAFQNVDVLLFRGVWGAYKTIKGSILGTNQRSSSLQLEMLDPFVRALQRLPLSAPQTEERRMMDEISATVNNCLPGFRSLVDPLAQQLIKSSPLRKGGSSSMSVSDTSVVASLSRSNTITEQVSATEEESLAHIRGLSAPMPQSSGADSDSPGVQLLLDFMAELLPVINPHADITQFTRLQSLVNTNQDFFLPFREQAPSRLRLTSSEGPFHAHHIDSSGAFASWVISRALMFNSEVLLNHTHGYFPDLSAWHALLTAERFDPNKTESLDRFFNVKCYGTPQPKRRKGNNYVPQYFLQGNEWKQFEVRHRPAPIPFLTCVQWLLDQPLEMVGDLTAYLLAADLSYTGKVMRPTPREVGRAIWTMQGGSLAGLVALGLVASENAPVQEVTAAFGTLYGRLDARLQGEDKVKMGWDPIMAEHLLCKFTRIRRREGWRPPKRQGRKTRRSWK
ncbi:hypothetical protein LXA43DRAFT_628527 [Ganoderma leucocontextum]|nr:hypothetical protein LXA43DRAFT_628527 [Ganoderma leucocontextum]